MDSARVGERAGGGEVGRARREVESARFGDRGRVAVEDEREAGTWPSVGQGSSRERKVSPCSPSTVCSMVQAAARPPYALADDHAGISMEPQIVWDQRHLLGIISNYLFIIHPSRHSCTLLYAISSPPHLQQR
jgi:hypothetical protein